MVRKVGGQIINLKRVRVANIKLGILAAGQWRYLTKKEKEELVTTQVQSGKGTKAQRKSKMSAPCFSPPETLSP